jgi:hypothetical protein
MYTASLNYAVNVCTRRDCQVTLIDVGSKYKSMLNKWLSVLQIPCPKVTEYENSFEDFMR